MYGSSNLETWTGVDVVHACRLSRCKSCVANAGQAEKAAGENLRVLDERVKNLTSKALMFQFPVKEGRSARSCRFLRTPPPLDGGRGAATDGAVSAVCANAVTNDLAVVSPFHGMQPLP